MSKKRLWKQTFFVVYNKVYFKRKIATNTRIYVRVHVCLWVSEYVCVFIVKYLRYSLSYKMSFFRMTS